MAAAFTDPEVHEEDSDSECLSDNQPMFEHQHQRYSELNDMTRRSSKTHHLSALLSLKSYIYPKKRDDERQYHPISSEVLRANLLYESGGEKTEHRRLCCSFSWILKAIICLLAFWGFVDLSRQTWETIIIQSSTNTKGNSSSSSISCNCGNSSAEAIAMGCKFELLAGGWLPEACRDDELADEFDHAGPGPNGAWGYYEHSNGSRELSVEEIGGAYTDKPLERYWTTFDWHLAHCMFYWRKQFRSQLTGRKVEFRHDTEAHIIHCTKMMFKERPVGNQIVTHNGVALNLDMSEIEEANFRAIPLTHIKPQR